MLVPSVGVVDDAVRVVVVAVVVLDEEEVLELLVEVVAEQPASSARPALISSIKKHLCRPRLLS
jgi:hypothetical protein